MPAELKKIELDTAPAAPTELPAVPMKRKRPGKHATKQLWITLAGVVGALAVVGILVYTLFVVPARAVYTKSQALMVSGKQLAASIKSQNLAEAKTNLATTRTDLEAVRAEYAKLARFSFLPFVGPYFSDGTHALNAGNAGLDAVDNAIQALEPNADLLGFKGTSSFVSGSADERIQTAVKTMEALTPKINEMATNIDTLRKEIDYIDPNRYPQSLRGVQVRSQLVSVKGTIDNAANLFVNAQPLLKELPSILGEPDEKRYLILFQNDKELRPTGGFITAYAQFRIVRGKMILEKSQDIYALDDSLTKKFPAPPEILTYHKNVFQLNIRDSNLSPDFKLSMDQFMNMYQYSTEKEHIDGIIAVDTHTFVEALKILGPITIDGREFSADNDPRCNCPKAVYELEDFADRPLNRVVTNRKDVIGVLMQTLMQKALGVSPSKYWGQLFQMLLSEINTKHVLAYFTDTDTQHAAESFNMAGRIMTATESAAILTYDGSEHWDYLHINNSNMAGAKANMFVSEAVTKDVTVNNDGTATTHLTVEYKNPYPGSDCGLESGGLCLNAPLRDWVRVYVPKGSKLSDSKGTQSPKDLKAVPMTTYDSLDKTVFEGFLIVNPLGTAQLDLTYTSPYTEKDGKYRLLIQKQPGTEGDEYTIKLNGKTKTPFTLETDTEVTL